MIKLEAPIYISAPCINADWDCKLRTDQNYLDFKTPVLMDTFEKVHFQKGVGLIKTICQNPVHERINYFHDINFSIYLN